MPAALRPYGYANRDTRRADRQRRRGMSRRLAVLGGGARNGWIVREVDALGNRVGRQERRPAQGAVPARAGPDERHRERAVYRHGAEFTKMLRPELVKMIASMLNGDSCVHRFDAVCRIGGPYGRRMECGEHAGKRQNTRENYQ